MGSLKGGSVWESRLSDRHVIRGVKRNRTSRGQPPKMADSDVLESPAGPASTPDVPLSPESIERAKKGKHGVKLDGRAAYHLWCDSVTALGQGCSSAARREWCNERLWSEFGTKPLVISESQGRKVRLTAGRECMHIDDNQQS